MSEERNVDEIFNALDDSVALINAIDADTAAWNNSNLSQEEINKIVQANVDHIGIALAYDEAVADSRSKTKYNNAVTKGNAYIAAN
jgi:hypothetical protein